MAGQHFKRTGAKKIEAVYPVARGTRLNLTVPGGHFLSLSGFSTGTVKKSIIHHSIIEDLLSQQ
jgi:hypothetical protein